MGYVYTAKNPSATREKWENERMPFAATWMNLEIIILSEVSQTEKSKYCITLFICGFKKIGTDEFIGKTEIESQM